MNRRNVLLILSIVACMAHTVAADAPAHSIGAVVAATQEDGAAHGAGLQPGDLLLRWSRGPEQGALESPFDVVELETEQGSRGEVSLTVSRQGHELDLVVPAGPWLLDTRPLLSEAEIAIHEEVEQGIKAGEVEAAVPRLQALAESASSGGKPLRAAWHLEQLADQLLASGEWDVADQILLQAVEAAREAGSDTVQALLHERRANAFARRRRIEDVAAALRAALQLRRPQGTEESVAIAKDIGRLGFVITYFGELAQGQEMARQAKEMTLRLAPDSLAAARCLHDFGVAAGRQGDFETALEDLGRALVITQRLVPESRYEGSVLANMGLYAFYRGDLVAAERHLTRALRIHRAISGGADTMATATALNSLALVSWRRGDLAQAEDSLRRCVAVTELHAPKSPDLAVMFNNLGLIALDRGDVQAAERYLVRGLELAEQTSAESQEAAASISTLGLMYKQQGKLEEAEGLLRQALAMREEQAPRSLEVAASLTNLGALALDQQKPEAAEPPLQKALAILEEVAPGCSTMAAAYNDLGEAALDQGDADAAAEHFQQALQIYSAIAPGSRSEATTLYRLAQVSVLEGHREQARQYHARAIDSLEGQVERLGGTQGVRRSFRAQNIDLYRDAIGLLIDLNQKQEAFHVFERSRARSLLEMLAERDLLFELDIPAPLDRERRLTMKAIDTTLEALGKLIPTADAAEIESLRQDLRSHQERLEEIKTETRRLSPRLASLQYPQPLDVAGAQQLLDPGTVGLCFSVSRQRTLLFVLTTEHFDVHAVPLGEEELRGLIERFRAIIDLARVTRTDPEPAEVAAATLYDTLIEPVADVIESSQRILIVPDGPLFLLPFAGLVRHHEGRRQYLVEWRPIHVAVSITSYGQLLRERSRSGPPQPASAPTLVAFGDPAFRSSARDDEDTGSHPLLRTYFGLANGIEPLPATRIEVESIARLFGRQATTYLGAEATEQRAKAVQPSTRHLHFATHALLDRRLPLNSALALAAPQDGEGQESENGLLQVWEIFEQLRVDADLVTLSGCETALGEEVAGEGMIGMTQAFQHAGAHSVLASLWGVADESTATLMLRFYTHLREGATKDAALRLAQIDMIRGTDAADGSSSEDAPDEASHPFHWAAFQLFGDWR